MVLSPMHRLGDEEVASSWFEGHIVGRENWLRLELPRLPIMSSQDIGELTWLQQESSWLPVIVGLDEYSKMLIRVSWMSRTTFNSPVAMLVRR
jgi:hypothetical protein